MTDRSPHLTTEQTRHLVDDLETAEGQDRRDLMTRLAWRPAWAIRSRRRAMLDLWERLRGRRTPS